MMQCGSCFSEDHCRAKQEQIINKQKQQGSQCLSLLSTSYDENAPSNEDAKCYNKNPRRNASDQLYNIVLKQLPPTLHHEH